MTQPVSPGQADKAKKRTIWGWALYDWANSAFATTVMAVFFPGFFKQFWNAGTDITVSTARLGFGSAAASLIVALIAPMMGAIADHGAKRKRFLILFTFFGVAMTAILPFVPKGQWTFALWIYIGASIGFSGGIVFYDGLLPHVAPPHRVDQVSSLGYAMGYLGGGLLLLVNVLMTVKPEVFGLAGTAQAVQFSFAAVAVWWGGFALLAFFWLPPDPVAPKQPYLRLMAAGWRQLLTTFTTIRQHKNAFIFLLAYWCYIDGVDTIVRMAVDYGMSIGFVFKDLVVALLITQFIGFPSALLFGQLGHRWGVRRSIYLALCVYMGVAVYGATMDRVSEFYALAAVIGLVQGGIQALSRSYFTRLIPAQNSAEYFGFYNMLGKFAAIVGPVLMGLTGLVIKHSLLPLDATPDQAAAISTLAARFSIASILLLFLIGGALFYFVEDPQKNR